MAEGNKRREWVKNAIIIFLVIMLILTFFSNTIMNYSLPEVSAQYVTSGALSEQIRGNANVEAAQMFEVKANETRVVASVEVKKGDLVEKGQVLMKLEEGDSAELEKAKDELESAEFEYKKMLISAGNDYSLDELAIKNLEKDIEQDKAAVKDISLYQKKYEQAKKDAENAKAAADKYTKAKKKYDDQLPYASSDKITDYLFLDDAYNKKLTAANEALNKAKTDKEAAKKVVDDLKDEAITGTDAETISKKRIAIEHAEEVLLNLENQYSYVLSLGDFDKADGIYTQITEQKYSLETLRAEYSALFEKAQKKSGYEIKLNNALAKQGKADKAYNEALEALETARVEVLKDLNSKIIKAADELDKANAALEKAKEAEQEAKEKASLTVEEAEKKIAEKERELENKKLTLAQTQKKDLAQSGISAIDIEIKQSAIDKMKANIEKLKEKSEGGEITASVAGMVESISCVAGEKLENGATAVTIQMVEKGYTASMNVSADQAKKIRTGDKAEIQYFWYGDAEAIVSAIKPDSANPQNRQVVFSVTGDVTPGQTLYLVLGTKGQQYDTIVPNSAIREDNNGKFVLVVSVKSSPLGNRYTANRVEVKVLASDDKSSAVSGELMQSDFIISTSTKPINPGDQVRLVDN